MAEQMIVIVSQKEGDEGRAYTLTLPDGKQTVIGDAEDDYWTLAGVIDRRFPVCDEGGGTNG